VGSGQESPFDTFLLCKIRSVHQKIPQRIGSGFSLPFHTSNCQIVIVASIIPYLIPRASRSRSRAETCSSFGGIRTTESLWCCDQLFRRTGDMEWLRRLYPKAVAYLRWWLDYRRDADGWIVYACSWESGQDVSSRFGPQQTGGTIIQHVRPVDLQASVAPSAEILFEAALSCTHASSPIFQRERHVHAGLPKVPQFAVW